MLIYLVIDLVDSWRFTFDGTKGYRMENGVFVMAVQVLTKRNTVQLLSYEHPDFG